MQVNWRGIFNPEGERRNSRPQSSENIHVDPPKDFTLTDVTGPSIPAVRELINDVMLDIPYFMSKHKQSMVQAMIGEANRVYRLWCRHNPGFHGNGRVHLVAHSLGSVMALDALSMQPTYLPDQKVDEGKASRELFEFDTKSVFFCGSPVGFFLHLERSKLTPRKGRMKPGAEIITTNSDLNGGRGEFGCMAVDNVYNIVHPNDPVAYLLNPCVDVNYANSLKSAYVPSLTANWFHYLFRTKPPSWNRQAQAPDIASSRPMISKLPSNVEMEVHNFTLEEIAENKMYLINDNGQVDWFLNSGGGALEFQYLNMLSAHSSYWTSLDFIRFLVVEVGRATGRHETIPNFRAKKVIRWKKSDAKVR